MYRSWIVLLTLVLLIHPARGQDNRKVPISFLPPPLENATYSIDIHDKNKKKHVPIRQLCEALPESAFTVGLNGLITSWDGNDDAGNPVPPGHYHAGGYAVGAVKITGKETIENEWMHADALPVKTVEAMAFVPDDEGVAMMTTIDRPDCYELMRYGGTDGRLLWHVRVVEQVARGGIPPIPSCSLEYKNGALVAVLQSGGTQTFAVSDGRALESAYPDERSKSIAFPTQSSGKDGTTWKIAADGVYQFSKTGEPLRHLGLKAGEPVPVAVAASPESDRLYLLECTPNFAETAPITGWQRVRGLSWVGATQEEGKPVSTWQTVFERNIHFPDRDVVGPGAGSSATVDLVENPLTPGRDRKLEVTVRANAKGTYLATGRLLLRQISQQTNVVQFFLKQNSPDSMTVLRVGGDSWGVYSVEGMKNIMAFDVGDIEMTADGEKTHPEKAAEPPDL